MVCGAPNVDIDQKIAFAPVGTTLPGDITISKVIIRGEVSEGMICSERELYSGTVYVSINGSFLSSNPSNQTTVTTDYDFYISSSADGKIAINKLYTGGVGINIDKADDIVIKYVLTTAP